MKLRIDYHLHPNLPKGDSKALEKCKKWWKVIKKNNINCVVVTEHSYKDPKRSFELMNKTKPSNLFCLPGVECLTKEGAHIVVFSENSKIYDLPELKPFETTCNQMVDFINSQKSLFGFIAHPYTLGQGSIIDRSNRETYEEALEKLGAVEISNGGFENLKILIGTFPFNMIFKSKLSKIKKNRNLPLLDYPKKIDFLAVGSDAHHFGGVGNCFEVTYPGNFFDAVTKNKGKGKIFIKNINFDPLLLTKDAWTSFNEFLTKTYVKFKGKV